MSTSKERDELARIVVDEIPYHSDGSLEEAGVVADAIIAAGYRKTGPEWGVRYDTHVDWVEVPAAGEAWARSIYEDRKDEGAIAIVRRYVTKWEVAS